MTGRVPLQAIRQALNDFRVGFTSMVGTQAMPRPPKVRVRVRVGLDTSGEKG